MKTFLICHRGALGDFILTWPAIHCLRKILPDYLFKGIGRTEYMRLAINLGLLDSFINMDSSKLLDLFNGKAIPPEIDHPSGAVLWLSSGQDVVNLLKKYASLPVVSIAPFPAERMHVAVYHCQSMQCHFPINIPKNLSDCFLPRTKKGNYALIHPGSGSPAKNYSPQFYLNLADELQCFGYKKVGFILGPAEKEIMGGDFSGEWIEQPKNLEELADLLKNASIYIGNDSGVSHLSGILGIPTITFYKSTDPEVWGTLGRKVAHIKDSNEKSALNKVLKLLSSEKWTNKSRNLEGKVKSFSFKARKS
ncbi:MAG: glycosyltransferase family 9 protein [Proteobacteria bacterium]|nr:glycosyltransferase family 9 protein [Pseudomonadota bacterium]MBU4288272.1 glycosyltransferase family 9 protein [Pseudomonadota bacterium]